MHALFIHSAREWSGAARAFTDAARGLAERGHAVSMLVEPESTVEQIVSQTTLGSSRYSSLQVESLTLGGFWLAAVFRVRAFLKAQQIKVAFVHTTREHIVTSFACWLGGRAQIVRRVPAGQMLVLGWVGRFATWLTPTCFLFTDEEDAQAARLPRKAAAKTVVPLGVQLPELETLPPVTIGSAREYIVCVHDDSSRSRAATAIRTLAMLVPRHPGLQLVIIGDSAYDDDLRMQAAALRVLNLVTFLGERDDALYVMRSARLGWVVANHDTAAYALLDFMGLEVPVLAGEHSMAERYVLSQITGVLLPSDDAHLTAATVAELLVGETARMNMGEAARARVQREYPMSAMIDGFEEAATQMSIFRRR